MFTKLTAFLDPGKRERDLSVQREELLERAERAELMAYEALAEAGQAKQERDDALEKIRQLETNWHP
jgi:hypothetical protein